MPIKKKPNRRSALQKYSDSITHGTNNSTKSQLKKIAKVDTKKKLPQVPLVDLHMYVDGVWVYKGVSCGLCQILMNDKTVINKHRYVCKVLNRKIRENNDAGTDDY